VSFVTEAITTTRAAGATGTILVRADSKFYTAEVVDACLRAGVLFSLSTGINPDITAAIAAIGEDQWVDIVYPHPIEDPDTGAMIPKAQVAEVTYPAFTGRRKRWHVVARLIVRRVRGKTPIPPRAKGNCSPSTATTRCSATTPPHWCRPRPPTASTPS